MKARQRLAQSLKTAKHQQARHSGTFQSRGAVSAQSTQLGEQRRIVKQQPWVVRRAGGKAVAVLLDRFGIEVWLAEVLHD